MEASTLTMVFEDQTLGTVAMPALNVGNSARPALLDVQYLQSTRNS